MSKQGRTTGRRSRALGNAAEAQVLAVGALYAARGVAVIWKRPTPMRQIGSMDGHGRFQAVMEVGAGCDFYGVIRGGTAFLLELKSTVGARLPLARRGQPTLKPEQAAELDAMHALGGLALVLVRVRDGWWLVHWPAWSAMAADPTIIGGSKSLGPVELDMIGARCPDSSPAGDWLSVAQEALSRVVA